MAEGGHIDVKFRANGVLERLKDCFGELQGIMSDCSLEERSDFVSSVREMVGALETGLKRVPEKQEESELKWQRMRSRGAGTCTHSCVHHAEILNPELWSKLTEDLVARVFARLPIPRIVELRKSSKAWATMLDSTSFKSPFAELNSNLLGLLGRNRDDWIIRIRILDVASKEWHAMELDIPNRENYSDSVKEETQDRAFWYSSDGGLVCLILGVVDSFDNVFVGNPLTKVWRKLPYIMVDGEDPVLMLDGDNPVLVQLVTNELFYRVFLVSSYWSNDDDEDIYKSSVYDSRTGSWSEMNSGVVYGMGGDHSPLIFDCTTKRLIIPNPADRGLHRPRFSIQKNCLFVLHSVTDPDSRSDSYVISKFTSDSGRSEFRKRNDYEIPVPEAAWNVDFFTSTGCILSTWDIQPDNETARQVIRIYDVSAGQWRDLPPFFGDGEYGNTYRVRSYRNTPKGSNEGTFLCELSWDANP